MIKEMAADSRSIGKILDTHNYMVNSYQEKVAGVFFQLNHQSLYFNRFWLWK